MIKLRWNKNHPIPDEISRNRLNQMREANILTDMAISSGLQVYNCHRIVVASASSFLCKVIKVR
jgi:hypothetical protein